MKIQRSHNLLHPHIVRCHASGTRFLLTAMLVTLGLNSTHFSMAEQDQTATTSTRPKTTSPSEPADSSSEKAETLNRVIDFEKLETTDNKIYQKVTVRKIEPDSLLIEHLSGVARVSLFDLSEEIQKHYEFDHDAAIEHYKRRQSFQRAMRKKLLLDRVRQQAVEEAEVRQQNLERLAKTEWIPVRAKIVFVKNGNALALVDRIVMKPTRGKTALGGEGLPGPPKKVYVRISKSPVWLKNVGDFEQPSVEGPAIYWTGYIWPDGEVSLNPKQPDDTTSAYRTIKPSK
jgi:hypothetical protein